MTHLARHFGKYRATVTAVDDPQQLGRVRLAIPDVLGVTPSAWAAACLPFAIEAASAAPPVGAGVWAEFEAGDPSLPIWSGYQATAGTTATVAINDAGVHLANGKGASVVLFGPTTIINDGGLTVT